MRYFVKLTPNAVGLVRETAAYISKVLLAPETAGSWVDHLEKEIMSLETMPARFPLIGSEPWRSLGYRKMTVGNFYVYYFVDEETKTVWVTAVVYARRDQLNALKDIPPQK